ncbi:MAG: ROK family protein [Deltaproteobacteria bacterium]|nr:ROK family protein [Deltaproteobacteria bacterium]
MSARTATPKFAPAEPARADAAEPVVDAAAAAAAEGAAHDDPADVPNVAAAQAVPPLTLCIDIGGSGLKAMVLDAEGRQLTERARIETPKPATTEAILRTLVHLVEPLGAFDRISVGFPGVVVAGVTQTAPNLDPSWAGFALAEELGDLLDGKPIKVLNDAGVQGHGVVSGEGVEMVLTLGTGMGCALFVDGRYVPNLELAHHPFRKGKSYEEYVGAKALEKVGKKRWNKRVQKVLDQINPIFNPRVIYVGGGNAKKLSVSLPDNVCTTDNVAGLLGGVKLWG